MRLSTLAPALIFAASFQSASFAVTLFSENFNGVSPHNYSTIGSNVGQFTLTAGNIDVIDPVSYAPNLTCISPTAVNCVDMNGQVAGTLNATINFPSPGTYRLSFDLIGSQRPVVSASANVQLGSLVPLTSYTLAWDERPAARTFVFSVSSAQSAVLSFSSTTAGATGLLLDNVLVTDAIALPEPGTLTLFVLSACFLALSLWKRRHV